MNTYQILCLFGFGSIGTAIMGYLIAKVRSTVVSTKALKLGLQALLRDRLLQMYDHYTQDKKYAPTYARENFLNMYAQYHSLGANGVMDDYKNKFLDLPNEPPEGTGKNE